MRNPKNVITIILGSSYIEIYVFRKEFENIVILYYILDLKITQARIQDFRGQGRI